VTGEIEEETLAQPWPPLTVASAVAVVLETVEGLLHASG